MNLVREQAAFLQDIGKLIQHASRCGFIVTGGELERKPELQEIYVKTGRNKTMDSPHLRKCAIDLNFFADRNGKLELIYEISLLQPIGNYWEALDPKNRWGGNWRTFRHLTHFERDPTGGAWLQTPAKTIRARATASVPPAIDEPQTGLVTTICRGSDNDRAVTLLQSCLKQLGYLDTIDGIFGPETETFVKRFQHEQGLVADGSVGDKTWTTLFALAPQVFESLSTKWLTQNDLNQAAEALQVESPTIKAVYDVQSGGVGFVGTRPKILFEGHVFWQRLKTHGIDPEAFRAGNDDILYENWSNQHYAGGLREYDRLKRARQIHEEAALESTSWGLFQIMGHHSQRLGYHSVMNFVTAMDVNEAAHLQAFCKFVEKTHAHGKPLVEYLRERDWAGFAFGYNDEQHRENGYDDKLEIAYNRARVALAA
ncbi:MAG: N-acetylmuramidase domain-containing protein [Pseudomonadota bacterium]|nr:N-acetylmuramidase domain-containing protein [Pseudomonadota bacterium]